MRISRIPLPVGESIALSQYECVTPSLEKLQHLEWLLVELNS